MKRRALYILGMTIWIAWLILSTPMIAYLNGGSKVKIIDFDQIPVKDSACWEITADRDEENLPELYSAEGYAFIEKGSEEDHPERKVSLVFRGESVCYEVPAELFYTDINFLFLNKPRKNGGHWHFAVDFSTLNIKDGTYDYFIFCRENEETYGLTDTGYQITKRNGKFTRHPARGKPVEDRIIPTRDEQFDVAIDTAAITETGLTIKGWAIVPEQNCTDRKVYIQLMDEQGGVRQFAAHSEAREDVARAYNEVRYGYCGYMMSLPAAELPDGNWELKLLIDHNGQVWESRPYPLTRDKNEITVHRSAEGYHKQTTVQTPVQNRQNIGEIEHLWMEDGSFYVDGWALIPGSDSAAQSVYVEWTDETGAAIQYTTTSTKMEVVAAGLKDARYANSGYVMSIPAQALENGRWTLRILVENEGEVWVSSPYTVEKDEENAVLLMGGEKMAVPLAATHEEKLSAAVDKVEQTGGHVTISGWCVAPGENCSGQTVSIELTDGQGTATQYGAASVLRVDVADGYGSADYANCGYWMTLPAGKVPDGNWQMRIFADKNGEVWESNLFYFTKTGDSIEFHS